MNQIEHLWDELGHCVQRQMNPPCTVAEFTAALQFHWTAIPQALIFRLCFAMYRRLQVCHPRWLHSILTVQIPESFDVFVTSRAHSDFPVSVL